MVDYVNAYDLAKNFNPVFIISSEKTSSVSIDAYLNDEEQQPGYDWNPSKTKIDAIIAEWLENNIEGNWTMNMCSREINFENNDDAWRFLEWLEEYELQCKTFDSDNTAD